MPQSMFKNAVLTCLSADSIQRLALRNVQFELEHEIEVPGSPIENLFFVEVGMASMTSTFADGSQVEVGMFGPDSVIGVSGLMGATRSLNRIYTQIAGHGYFCSINAGRKEFERHGEFHALALRCVQSQLVHATQSAACNAKHSAEQRLARWLLLCADRSNSFTYALSQDFLATMLGSTRPTVSLAAGFLKDEGLIKYSRGVIHILDVAGLEKRACECYRTVKSHLENYAEFGRTAQDSSGHTVE